MNINQNPKRKLLAVLAVLAMLIGTLPGSVFAAPMSAQVIVPVPGEPLTVNVVAVNNGTGGQSNPHVSGDWVSYWDYSAFENIRFQNLDMGTASDRLIPTPAGFWDELDDINGNTIVFMRATGSSAGIYMTQINAFGDPDPVVEVSQVTYSLRRRPAIGGDTIAYEDHTYDPSSSGSTEISLSSVVDPAAPVYRLTNDTLVDWFPAVSPDGNAVVWLKSTVATSDPAGEIWRAERTNGVWGAPEQLPGETGDKSSPDTNGAVTVYASDAGGDQNIRWTVKDESSAYVESVLDLPGVQRNPNIAGNYILFESNAAYGTQFDIYLYDLVMNRLYRLTDTSISEALTDISTAPGGLVRLVWAQPKQVYPYDMDVYAMSFLQPDVTPPTITPTVNGTLGASGWYSSDISLTWTVSDLQSVISSATGCETVSITQDQTATDYTCTATSDGGTSSETATIARDATKPVITVTGVTEGASYTFGSVPQAGCSTTDNLSGVATEATLALTGGDSQGVGQITATCSGALDAAGNTADPAVIHYTVSIPSTTYSFTGFFQPVDNPGPGPTYVFNSVKAGAAVPVKFSLRGDQGLDIFAAGFPTSRPASCTTAAITDPIEQTVTAGNSSLTYDPSSDTYTYVWKTIKGWTGCRVLTVQLDDGTQHLAYFKFK